MAATQATTPDTPVTLKVSIDGTKRRFKLPLRDMGAASLPEKLRLLLAIPPTSEAVFERYSDSAADFVVLNPQNTAVYKQLCRAAKAKHKLRLRVTVKDKEPVIPKPATVEDEEPQRSSTLVQPVVAATEEATRPLAPGVRQPTLASDARAELERRIEKVHLDRHVKTQPEGPMSCRLPLDKTCPRELSTSTVASSSTDIPVTHTSAARDQWFAELLEASDARRRAVSARPANPPPGMLHVFSVYCNNCDSAIPDEHYHCDTCDEGDFDLCQACIAGGVTCKSEVHWMIKRLVKNGKVIKSTTEVLSPKPKSPPEPAVAVSLPCPPAQTNVETSPTRTCNCCVSELPDESFVTCTTCEDYDLCIPCHVENQHGHHPQHGFAPAVEATILDPVAQILLSPGRNVAHNAICDGCDKYIYGVRHKCLDCPDWDYCAACVVNASLFHPRHKFVPIYEPFKDTNVLPLSLSTAKPRHFGIYCDGPRCQMGAPTYIRGDRYKCAVCHDTDFCATCEASPSNSHNRTHPLIKFKTPVRDVNVTTFGEQGDGQKMAVMGDRHNHTVSKATETASSPSTIAATQVQTVADLRPTEQVKAEVAPAVEVVKTPKPPAAVVKEDLVAHFVRDTVADGTVMAQNTVFEQTWYLRNAGISAWPAGCTVKFVGGDNMCAVDPDHPASVHELVCAAESTTWYSQVEPGQEAGFAVLMRTPNRTGNFISYWRLTGPNGEKFGHRLWCDVTVKEVTEAVEDEADAEGSRMIFPKLDKESPTTSFHEDANPAPTESNGDADNFDEVFDEAAAGDDETEDGFLTDEEYDVLDASDEEYLFEQQKNVRSK